MKKCACGVGPGTRVALPVVFNRFIGLASKGVYIEIKQGQHTKGSADFLKALITSIHEERFQIVHYHKYLFRVFSLNPSSGREKLWKFMNSIRNQKIRIPPVLGKSLNAAVKYG